MSEVTVRPEEPWDREASLGVERLAFGASDEAEIIERVRDEAGSLALVAVDGDRIIGHAQLSRAWIGELPVLALGPIGAVPERQGAGIGSSLVRSALEEARRLGEAAVILLGSQDYYPRFGFVPAASMGLRNPFAGVQESGFVVEEEDFMVATLVEPGLAFAGEVRWHPAFGEPVEAPGEPR